MTPESGLQLQCVTSLYKYYAGVGGHSEAGHVGCPSLRLTSDWLDGEPFSADVACFHRQDLQLLLKWFEGEGLPRKIQNLGPSYSPKNRDNTTYGPQGTTAGPRLLWRAKYEF